MPLNQARRALFSCVMVVSDILAVRINLPFARGATWIRQWSFCVRPAHEPARESEPVPQIKKDAYEWQSWPHSPQDELEIACRRLREAEDRILDRTAVAKELTKEVEERTAWALRLDKELAKQTACAEELNPELERLAWARMLCRLALKVYRKARRKQ